MTKAAKQAAETGAVRAHSLRDRGYYFVFGNHASTRIIEDYFVILKECLQYCLGETLQVSEEPVPGHWNFYLENFNDKDIAVLRQAKERDAGTRVVCIATEYLTGGTFNRFKSQNTAHESQPLSAPPSLSLVMPLRHFLHRRGMLRPIKQSPFGRPLLAWFRRYKARHMLHHYGDRKEWSYRYNRFLSALPLFNQIWCVDPAQIQGYLGLIESHRLWLFPIIPYRDDNKRPENKPPRRDIDFVFTGTMTPYRNYLVDQLRKKGFSVVASFYDSYIRHSYQTRAKIALHIKQDPVWSFSSTLRLHTLLMNSVYVLAESSGLNARGLPQTPFVHETSSEEFIKTAAEVIRNPDLPALGSEARERYIHATRNLRQQAKEELQRMLVNLT